MENCYFIEKEGKEKGMKKTYQKPQAYVEKFELAEHIAGCSLTINSGDVNVCVAEGTVQDEYLTSWFTDKNQSCTVSLEGYCYTNSSMNVATISS